MRLSGGNTCSRGTSLASGVFLLVVGGTLGVSCSKRVEQEDQAAVKAAIAELESGRLNKLISEEVEASKLEVSLARTDSETPESEAPALTQTPELPEGACRSIPTLESLKTNETLELMAEDEQAALGTLGQCMRDVLIYGLIANMTFDVYRSHKMLEGEVAFSKLLEEGKLEDLLALLEVRKEADTIESFMDETSKKLLRNTFDDSEVDELLKLAKLRTNTLSQILQTMFNVFNANAALITKLEKYERIKALKILQATAALEAKKRGVEAAKAFYTLYTGQSAYPDALFYLPNDLLHPFATMLIVPQKGAEKTPLSRAFTLFDLTLSLDELLAGPDKYVEAIVKRYKSYRDVDNPKIPDHLPAKANAVRVAVMDTGLDFTKFPELGLFLGRGGKDEISSMDYSDGDRNAWLPATGTLAHGTGTTSTVLTILAKHAPEALEQRMVDLAVWKVRSLRNVLGGGYGFNSQAWENRLAPFIEAIYDRTKTSEVQADIVSVSLGFYTDIMLKQISERALLNANRSLWVMASGNEAMDVTTRKFTCFDDIPETNRPTDRIVCVGAMKRAKDPSSGTEIDVITDYSNFGKRVDVYAYESYDKLCPNGTSCSTPAISGAMAALKAKFPSAKAEDLKRVLVAASEEREVVREEKLSEGMIPPGVLAAVPNGTQVAGTLFKLMSDGTSMPQAPEATEPKTRKIRVFDPSTMMDRLMKEGERLLATPVVHQTEEEMAAAVGA